MTILILTIQENKKTANLRKVFGGFSHVVIEDKKEQELICGLTEYNRKTAWDYAFDYIEQNKITGPVAFVEDDVAGPRDLFEYLFEALEDFDYDLVALHLRSKEDLPGWALWNRADPFFENPYKMFNPFTIMSHRMLEEIFEFKKRWGRVTYLEVFFASLAMEKGLTVLDFQNHEHFACLFPYFHFNPSLNRPVRGICHPVKSDWMHGQVCFGH